MSLTARKFTHISAAEYLAAENDSTWRHEFINGVLFAMAGASRWHNLTRDRLAATLLGRTAQGRRVFSGEMKLQIKGRQRRAPLLYPTCSSPAVRTIDTVTFESVGLTINVSGFYRDIDFDDPAPPPGTWDGTEQHRA